MHSFIHQSICPPSIFKPFISPCFWLIVCALTSASVWLPSHLSIHYWASPFIYLSLSALHLFCQVKLIKWRLKSGTITSSVSLFSPVSPSYFGCCKTEQAEYGTLLPWQLYLGQKKPQTLYIQFETDFIFSFPLTELKSKPQADCHIWSSGKNYGAP